MRVSSTKRLTKKAGSTTLARVFDIATAPSLGSFGSLQLIFCCFFGFSSCVASPILIVCSAHKKDPRLLFVVSFSQYPPWSFLLMSPKRPPPLTQELLVLVQMVLPPPPPRRTTTTTTVSETCETVNDRNHRRLSFAFPLPMMIRVYVSISTSKDSRQESSDYHTTTSSSSSTFCV